MLAHTVREAAARFGEAVAFVDPDGSATTYRQLDQRSDAVAAGMATRGIGVGDRVALQLPSDTDYVVAYVAAAKVGAVTAGINPRLAPPEQQALVDLAEPALLLTDPGEVAGLATEGEPPPLPDDSDRPVAIVFTSGTTGLPKGAVFTDRAGHDLSSLRLAVTGAAAIPVSLVEQMWRDLGIETVLTAYGLTEATGFVTSCRADDDAETIATTSGRAIPDVEVRIADDDGTALAPGEPGEILVRGYNVMPGYFEEPERTAETVDPDGWLHTGDIGWMDERGYIRITDRKKDMYIVGGFNAYPAEIENLLSRHPDIGQVAVVGVPDERLGEVGMAFVVPAVGCTPDPDEIVAWSREQMANYKVPRHVRIVDALPLNPAGKVLKYQLREEARR